MTLHFLLIILHSYQFQPFTNNLCAWINHSITPFLFFDFFFFFLLLNSRLLYFAQLWNVCPTNHPRLRLQQRKQNTEKEATLIRSDGIRLRAGKHNCLMSLQNWFLLLISVDVSSPSYNGITKAWFGILNNDGCCYFYHSLLFINHTGCRRWNGRFEEFIRRSQSTIDFGDIKRLHQDGH